jgi:hypothetical protein
MWGLRPKQATSATMALVYITVGALMVVWTIIYYIYLSRNNASSNTFLWCYGFFFTGLVLIAIGFAVGRIGRAARQAEVASTPVTPGVPAAPVAPTAGANGAPATPAAPATAPTAPAAVPVAPVAAPPAGTTGSRT